MRKLMLTASLVVVATAAMAEDFFTAAMRANLLALAGQKESVVFVELIDSADTPKICEMHRRAFGWCAYDKK